MNKKSFAELERELAEVMERIERAEYDELDNLLTDYDSGKKIIEELEKRLQTAKNSISKIKKHK